MTQQLLAPLPAQSKPFPLVPVFDRHVRGYPETSTEKPWRASDMVTPTSIDQALRLRFNYDAHFCAYEAATAYRLNSAILQQPGTCVRMVLFVVDVDGPDHGVTSEWRAVERQKVDHLRAMAPGFVYFETRGGYRLVWQLNEPLELETNRDAAIWSQLYCAWLAWLERAVGIVGDPNCKDWTRLYRLPFVRRDGVDQELSAFGDLREGTWDWRGGIDRIAPANTNANANKVIDYTDGEPAPVKIVDPLLDRIVAELAGAGRWEHGRQAYFLSFVGWLLGKGWMRSELERLVERMSSKHATYLDMVRRAHPMGGPGEIESKKLMTAEAFARLDAAVNAHPNAMAKHEEWRAEQDAKTAGLRERMAAAAPQPVQPIAAATGPTPAPASEPLSATVLSVAEKRTDLGNARRLVRLHGADLRYFKARGVWYCWDGVRWKADNTGAAIRAAKATAEDIWNEAGNEPDEDKRKSARKWAAQCQDRSRITNMIALAESEPRIAITAHDLDANPWLLNVQNGTLDLRSGILHAPQRELLMTKVTAAPYVPHAYSPLWEAFVQRLTGDDVDFAAYVQRAMGYALFGAWREKMFWFGYGPPDGAKSTFLGVLTDVLGDYAVSADASTWMLQTNTGGNRGDVTRLMGARLVTTSEVRPSARFDPQLMKGVTGGDTLTAAAKYEAEISFRPTFALWFGANERPIIPDDDDGFWSRVRCVPFVNVIPKSEQDKALREKLTGPEHAPAVLAWAVQGFATWQAQGIGTCVAVETATTRYRRDMNQAAGFFDENCELTGNDTDVVPAAALRAAYDTWCRSNGVQRPLQSTAWRRRLLALGVRGGDDASRVNGQRYWIGLKLRFGEGA